jgi:arylsulfatase A-like enzyme
MFIGDNGTPGQLSRSSGGSRGRAKGSLHDAGTRVPLVVSGPGVKRGRSDALVNATDLYATILGLAGRGSSAEDSLSLLPVLQGGASAGRQHAYVEHFTKENSRGRSSTGWAIRDARYKLVQMDGAPAELYDMISDSAEQRDLLASGAAGAQEAAARLAAARQELLR